MPDDLKAMILRWNLPLTESLATSIAIGREQRDGYVERPFDGIRTGNRDRWSARGAVRWEPTDAFAASLIVDYTTIDELRGLCPFPPRPGPAARHLHSSQGTRSEEPDLAGS